MSDNEILHFNAHTEKSGKRIEMNKDTIPFSPVRIYYLYDTQKDIQRGHHAHRRLQQLLISMGGACTVLIDDGNSRQEYRLDSPTMGLHIHGIKWCEIYNFSEDSMLMVLADEPFDEADYIRDYDDFLRIKKAGR